MPVVPLQCPLCTGVLQIDSAWGGQQVACPLCQGAIALPAEAALLAMLAAPPPAPANALHCPVCSGPFQVAPALAAQQVNCPHCGSLVAVPALAAGPPTESHVAAQWEPAREQPATIDDLLPPGAAAAPAGPPAQSQPAGSRRRPAEAAPGADDRFPPGYRPPTARREPRPPDVPRPPEPAPAKKPKVDVTELLPPGAAEAEPTPVAHAVASPVVPLEPLLPPGAGSADAAAVPHEQLPIPAAPQRAPAKPAGVPPGAIAVPTDDGGYVVVTESSKTVGGGEDAVEVRRLTPEEKARRRFRRGVILWGFCILVLLVVFYLFSR